METVCYLRGTGTGRVQDGNTEDTGLLGDTVGLSGNGTGDVGTVALRVTAAGASEVAQEGSTALKILERY